MLYLKRFFKFKRDITYELPNLVDAIEKDDKDKTFYSLIEDRLKQIGKEESLQ